MFSNFKRISQLLSAAHKKQILFILIIIFFQALIETIGIAAIIPFLAIVASPEMVETNKILKALYALSPVNTVRQFMLFLGSSFFLVIALGNLFASFAAWYFLRFSMLCGHQLSSDLFKNYLMQSYTFFINRNSSILLSNIFSEVSRVILGILINLLQLFNKCIMTFFLFALLFYIDWKLACSVISVLGTTYLIAFLTIRKKLHTAGETSSICNTQRYKAVNEAFAVIKELKLLGNEKYFLEIYNKYSKTYALSETNAQVLPQLSRYVIEIIAFGGILLIVLYLLVTQSNLSKALPLLGLYALSGYRLMPALQLIFASLSTIKYHSSALKIIEAEFQLQIENTLETIKPLKFSHSIVFNNLSFSYQGAAQPALQNVHFTVQKNSSVGIVGASGAGKTTLVDLLLGLFLPQEGAVCVDDIPISEENLQAWRANIGYVPQTIRLVDDTIKKNIALGMKEEDIDENRLFEVAQMAGIMEFIEALPQGYNTIVGEEGVRLSGGQKQRLGIARALYHDPQVLVLDEATSALDTFSEKLIVETLKNVGHEKTIIIIAHRLSTVRHCQEILLMEQGKVIDCGSYEVLFKENKHFYAMANGII